MARVWVGRDRGKVRYCRLVWLIGLPNEPTINWLNEFNQMQLYHQPDAVQEAIGLTGKWLREKTF